MPARSPLAPAADPLLPPLAGVRLAAARTVEERALRIDLVPAPLSESDPPRALHNPSATLRHLEPSPSAVASLESWSAPVLRFAPVNSFSFRRKPGIVQSETWTQLPNYFELPCRDS